MIVLNFNNLMHKQKKAQDQIQGLCKGGLVLIKDQGKGVTILLV